MKKVLGLVILLALPLLTYGQARNTGIKLKGPLYQDAVLILTRTQIQVRAEIPFYIYSYVNETYAKKPGYPTLLGIRYERLGRSDIGFGVELEYNGFTAFKSTVLDTNLKVPKNQAVLKFTPFVRAYFRRNRKMVFRGAYLQGGPTIMQVKQVLTSTQRPNRGTPYKYNTGSIFGLSFGLGLQHTFGPNFTGGIGAEAIFCGSQFEQEGFSKVNIGNGAIIFNPLKFYLGARF
jgi:hypothetical protein